MNIIFKLTYEYVRRNRRRTVVAIIGISGMMVVLTAVYIFSNAFLDAIIDRIAREEGTYHVTFHENMKHQAGYVPMKGMYPVFCVAQYLKKFRSLSHLQGFYS